jgi:regulator of sirC expression with transglutaminase-like and TPR domain
VNRGLDRFAEVVSHESFSLAEASLLIAQDIYADLDVTRYLDRLNDMAETVRSRIPGDAFAEQKILAINHHLFRELEFLGNIDNYYDPRNSYLNEVIDRHTGIPITLSILYMEVGRRLGLNIHGISFPGHFLVKLKVKRGHMVIDPFIGGETQSESDLRQRLAQVLPAPQVEKAPIHRYLEPASPRQIIARMLRNLKNIYMQADRPESALDVMQRMLLLLPESVDELRDRGLLYQRLECFRPALSDLRNYLRRRPDASDAGDIRARIADLEAACARLN